MIVRVFLLLQECSAGYWPGAILQPITYGKLSVELNVERNSGSYSYRDLCVTNSKVGGWGCGACILLGENL